MDGAERQRHVAPVAALLGIVLVHGQQLDHGHAEGGEPGQLVDEGAIRPWRVDVGLPGHAADVQLVDDVAAPSRPGRCGRRPRPGDGERTAPGVVDAALRGQRPVVAGWEPHLRGPRIQQHLRRVEARAVALGDEAVDRVLGDLADERVAVALQPLTAALAAVAIELDQRDDRGVRRPHPHRDHESGASPRSIARIAVSEMASQSNSSARAPVGVRNSSDARP